MYCINIKVPWRSKFPCSSIKKIASGPRSNTPKFTIHLSLFHFNYTFRFVDGHNRIIVSSNSYDVKRDNHRAWWHWWWHTVQWIWWIRMPSEIRTHGRTTKEHIYLVCFVFCVLSSGYQSSRDANDILNNLLRWKLPKCLTVYLFIYFGEVRKMFHIFRLGFQGNDENTT